MAIVWPCLQKHAGYLVRKAFDAAERISVAAKFSWGTAMLEAHRSVFRYSGQLIEFCNSERLSA